jgi:hypothetical protein
LIFFNRYPYGHDELAVCEDFDQVCGAMEKYPAYQGIFAKLSFGESQMLDKAFYEEEVKRLTLTFEQQVCITLTFPCFSSWHGLNTCRSRLFGTVSMHSH